MEIDLKALRCFVMLADELNFSRAADRLNMTQPALSSQIRVLETRLGLALFVRTTRRVALSEQGTALLPSARRIVEESQSLQRAVADLQGRPRRKLGLGAAFYTINIPERVHLLEGFYAAHPSVALDVVPAWQRDLVEDLQNDRLDIALVIGLPVSRLQLAREVEIEPNVEILYPDDLPRMVLRREPVGLLVPRESALSVPEVVPQAALAGLRVAMLGPHHGQAVIAPIRSMLDSAGATPVIPPEPHGIGVERFGRQFRIPAITLGWFGAGGPNDDMVRRPVEGLYLSTELALLRAPGATTAEAALFWDDASVVLEQAQAI